MSVMVKPGAKTENRLLDTVIYLASLASDPHVIDPLLNEVRSITAKLQPGESLHEHDLKQLEHVRYQLQDHLLHRDAVRQFTPETLAAKLTERFGEPGEEPQQRQALKEVGYVMIMVAASFLLGFGVSASFEVQQKIMFGSMLALATLYLGISWLFWTSLSGFSKRLQQAYRLICIGYIVTGIGVSVVPLAPAFPELGEGLLRYGVIMPVFILANYFIFSGTRLFARTIALKTRVTSRRTVFGLAAFAALIVMPLPHPAAVPSELWFDLSVGSAMALVIMAGGSARVAYDISLRTTEMYARAMKWFSLSMGMVAVSAALTVPLIFFFGRIDGLNYVVSSASYSIAGILMVISAYMFRRSSGSS